MGWLIAIIASSVLLFAIIRSGSLSDKRDMKRNCSHLECKWVCNMECPDYDPNPRLIKVQDIKAADRVMTEKGYAKITGDKNGCS